MMSLRGAHHRFTIVGVLIGLAAVKAALALWLYEPTRVWLHQDDYCRALMSLYWGQEPYLHPYDMHWLPLQFYVYGMASWLDSEHVQRTFVIVSQALAALTMLPIYGLTRTFFSRRAAVLACVLYVFASWQIVMSFSALAEPLYYFVALCGVHFFCRWWVGRRLWPLAWSAVFLVLAALTRYEGWVLLGLIGVLGLVRVRRMRPARGEAWGCVALLAVPWLVPALWVAENMRMQGAVLAFYGANRESFAAAVHDYSADVAGFLGRFFDERFVARLPKLGPVARAFFYPGAFVALSLPLTGLLVMCFLRRRAWFGGRAGILWAVAMGHLALLTAMYVSGSGPSFIMRIVLFHLFVLLPICGAALAIGFASSRRVGRVLAVAFLASFVVSESYHARTILSHRWHSDYRLTGDEYARIGAFVREQMRSLKGELAVQCHDDAQFVRLESGRPWRVHNVKGETAATVFQGTDIEVLCVPTADIGNLYYDGRIEEAFRSRHAGEGIVTTERGNWRVLRCERR